MSTILFATWDGGGNVPPLLALAAEVQRRGHTVTVLGHTSQEAAVRAAGLRFAAYPTARPFTSAAGPSPVAIVGTWGDRAMGRDVGSAVADLGADLVVVDCLLFGVMEALVRQGTPYVVLEHLFDHYLRGPGTGGPIGLGLRLKGLRPPALLDAALLCLVASLSELDSASGRPLAPNAVHTGPFVTGRPARTSEPTVLLSLSTYTFPGMRAAWQRALDAVAGLPIRVIATTGPAVDPGSLRPGANTELRAWAAHADLMPEVSMVVGHGGHSTTMLALAHDLPLVVMPMFRLVDQPLVGRAVQRAGAGLVIRKSTSVTRIRAAVERVLGDVGYRTAAAALGDRIRERDGLRRAADLVLGLVPDGTPA
jgi:UDP:flavonoid glycosyltransferase YjiC (YdhE family)